MSDLPPMVIITGTNGGLGSAMVARFRAEGVAVLGIDKHPDRHGLDHFVRFDIGLLAVQDSQSRLLAAAMEPHLSRHRLVGLINNAAVQLLGSLDELTLADFTESIGVNLTGPLMLTKLVSARLAAQRGTVLNIGSIHARLTKPRFVSYATSKAALLGLTQALSVDQGTRLRVVALLPAAVETEMLLAGFAQDPASLERLREFHPSGAIGTVEEVARLCHHLVRESYPFLHGAVIDMTGGIVHRLHDPV